VALGLTALKAGFIHVHNKHRASIEGYSQWLRTSHAAAAARQSQRSRQGIIKTFAGNSTEGFISALQDTLGRNVNPRAGRHLAVHHQPFVLELAEVLPVCPVSN